MQRTFKSKTGFGYTVLLIVSLLTMCTFVWFRIMIPALFLLMLNVFFVKAFLKTEYIITDRGILYIHSGYLPVKSIDINQITTVENIHSIWGLYAKSADKLCIKTSDCHKWKISPDNKKDFIKTLHRYNPGIQANQ